MIHLLRARILKLFEVFGFKNGGLTAIQNEFPQHAAEGAEGAEHYAERVANELANFENDAVVHNLPDIFHYWSNKYLLPTISQFGFIGPDDFFVKQLAKVISSHEGQFCRIISLGAGNCDTEVRVAQALVNLGFGNFEIECLDLNPAMLSRGSELAQQMGVQGKISPVAGDFNQWSPSKVYQAVMANQSLHHVLSLENLFDVVLSVIEESRGMFIVSDMIGCNGHQRWPEALAIVEEYWTQLPESYKYNHQLKRVESEFVNWDCSTEGFEGIRAQDILPLLNERFHFDLFVPFSNLITPFIDRGFGPNFNVDLPADLAFIDRVHQRDVDEIYSGSIKPTQMFAVMSTNWGGNQQIIGHLTPEFCIRYP